MASGSRPAALLPHARAGGPPYPLGSAPTATVILSPSLAATSITCGPEPNTSTGPSIQPSTGNQLMRLWKPSTSTGRRAGSLELSEQHLEPPEAGGLIPTSSNAVSPLPTPMCARPPETWCRVANDEAMTAGWRVTRLVTAVPNSSRDVAEAARYRDPNTSMLRFCVSVKSIPSHPSSSTAAACASMPSGMG